MREITTFSDANLPELAAAVWHKSPFSNPDNCVEVAFLGSGDVAVRDSKDRARPALVYSPCEWDAFLAAARIGFFDRPAGRFPPDAADPQAAPPLDRQLMETDGCAPPTG